MFGHFQTAPIFKQSASNLKVWQLRHWEVIKFVDDKNIKSILDLGCNQGKLLQKLQRGYQAQLLVGVDIDIQILQQAKLNIHPEPLQTNLMMERSNDQIVRLYHGNALHKYKQLRQLKFQLVTLIQVIQHLYPQQINDLTENIFQFINPKYVIITTPNKDFNCFFDWQNNKKMRHEDHKFQWTRTQFKQFVEQISAKYNYNYIIYGVGQHVSDDSKGFCTQIAVFQRKQNEQKQIFSEIKKQPALNLICEQKNICWKNYQQQLIKQAIYNSLIYNSDRVQWEQGINYLKKTRIFKLLSGETNLQQSLSNIRTDFSNSIVTKQFLTSLFKTMDHTILFDQYGYERRNQFIQESFPQDWNDQQDNENIALNFQTPKQFSVFFDSNNSQSLSYNQQQSFNNSMYFSSDSRNNQYHFESNISNASLSIDRRSINKNYTSILSEQEQFPSRIVRMNNVESQENNNSSLHQQNKNCQSDQDSWN